jgi:phosphoribosylaminoimidazole-succinocarboxamide synthase
VTEPLHTKPSLSLPAHKVQLLQMLYAGVHSTLDRTDLDELGKKYEGKVRDNYSTGDGRRYIVVTDRISAFDRVLGTIPYKGQLLTRMAAYWFDKTRDIAANHMLSVPDPNVMECIECRPLPVEMVVRGYITGVTSTSIWTHYQGGKREFCGHTLPNGLNKNDKLPRPILTPSTKAEKGGHDISASRDEILALTKMPAAEFDAAAQMAMALYEAGRAHAAARGLILVDTKYEFGVTPDGKVIVIDEIHTPDSSRYWFAESYRDRHGRGEEPDSFDKEYVRRWLAAEGYTGDGDPPKIPDEIRVEAARRYVEAFERITGDAFEPDGNDPLPRIRENLGLNK